MLVMFLKPVFVAFLISVPCLVCGKLDDGIILTYQESNHVEKVYSDGKAVVFAFFTPSNQLVDCDIREVNSSVSMHFFKEAIDNEEVKAELKALDIRRLIRQCKRFVRKMLRKKQDDSDLLVKDIKKRLRFHVGYEGTAWCSSNPDSMSNRTADPNNSKTDNCCKKLHTCKNRVLSLEKKHGFLNRFPWTVYSCKCVDKFRNCLQQVNEGMAMDAGTVYFDVINSRCFELEKKKSCANWSEWFNVCLSNNTETVAKIRTQSGFIGKK